MWGIKMRPVAGSLVNLRLLRLQRIKRRKLGPRCVLETFLDWCRSLVSPSGVAHVISLACLVVQTVCIDAFLITYMSPAVLLTLAVEIPLLLHLAWFWREESAHRAAPSEWLAYSWVHAAKVVVLFCRVMPRLPVTPAEKTEERTGNDRLFGLLGLRFDGLYTPTTLQNLLLLTPVFYALLMYRTSKAIFGKFTHRITVDLILHYDMLWHVVIDMVDQVDMFSYARLPQWETVLTEESLVYIQTVIPLLLFLSMVLQAQAFPGIVVDRWTIPEAPAQTQDRERERGLDSGLSAEILQQQSSARCASGRPHQPMATLRERSMASSSSGSVAAAACGVGASSSSSSMPVPQPVPPPAPAPTPLRPAPGLPGPPLLPPPLQRERPGSLPPPAAPAAPISPSPCGPKPLTPHSGDLELLFEQEPQRGKPARSASASRPSRPALTPEPRVPPVMRHPFGARRSQSLSRTWTGSSVGALRSSLSKRSVCSSTAATAALEREQSQRLEKERRRRLQDIIDAIQRQSIIIARKRSAMVSIFFTDIPFLAVRVWLWILLGHTYFPGLGVKNAICIVLNAMQATLVRFADRASFRDIREQLTQYHVRFVSSSAAAGAQGLADTPESDTMSQSPAIDAASDGAAGSSKSTPQEDTRGRTRSHAKWRRKVLDAERSVMRGTLRSTGVCVHFWSLLLAFIVGFLLAKGEWFFIAAMQWLQDPERPLF